MFGSPETIELSAPNPRELNDLSIHRVQIVTGAGWYLYNTGRIYIVQYVAGLGFRVLQNEDYYFNIDHCTILESF